MRDTSCVVRVGAGRGFLVEEDLGVTSRRLVVTAAHCLPKLPPPHLSSYTEERTYGRLLGPLNGKRKVWAECLFVDPVTDIAVLGAPDSQTFSEEEDAYYALTEAASVLPVGPAQSGAGYLLSVKSAKWIPVKLQVTRGPGGAWISCGPTKAGMSGSPILDEAACAVGIVAVGGDHGQMTLTDSLPGWLLRGLKV